MLSVVTHFSTNTALHLQIKTVHFIANSQFQVIYRKCHINDSVLEHFQDIFLDPIL